MDICRRLEGLPLAIELAAAKMRMLTPQAIADRLSRALPLLTAGVRDLPERHRTVRATLDWSAELLSAEQRELLADLGVFAERFTLEAVEAIGAGRPWDGQAVDGIAALVDASLVTSFEVGGRPVLSLLSIVREYALGRLAAAGRTDAARRAHADHYSALVARIAPRLRGAEQAAAVDLLSVELANLRAALRHLVYTDRLDDAGAFAWDLLIYWWIVGLLSGVRVWMLELLAKEQPVTDRTRAVAHFFALWGEMWQHPAEEVVEGMTEVERLFRLAGDDESAAMAFSARATARVQLPRPDLDLAEAELRAASALLHRLGNGWAEAITEVALGRVAWLRGSLEDALAHFAHATAMADRNGDVFTRSMSDNHRGRLLLVQGSVDEAEAVFVRSLVDTIRIHHEEGVAYGLEGLCAVAGARGDARRAGALSAAAAVIRRRVGVFDVEAFSVHALSLDALRARDPDAVADGERRGVDLTLAEAVALALPEAQRGAAAESLAAW